MGHLEVSTRKKSAREGHVPQRSEKWGILDLIKKSPGEGYGAKKPLWEGPTGKESHRNRLGDEGKKSSGVND